MKARGGGGRSRVLDGLIVAAVALLALKGLSFVMSPAEPDLAADGLPSFAHVFGYARSNYIPLDPTTTGSVPDKPKEAPPGKADEAKAAPPRDEPPPPSASQRAIGERLGERREELQRKSRDLDTREKLIEELERRIDTRADELRKTEEKQPGSAAAAVDAEAAGLKPLVTMYETMKPKDAARVFERLPQDVLVPVVRQINPRKMAEILAAMSPDSAEKLTVALAARARGQPGDRVPMAGSLPPGELQAIDPPVTPKR